jgi:hypothetical protein
VLYLHRGVLMHAVLAFPGGRPSTLASRAVIVVGYVSSLIPSVTRNPVAVLFISAMMITAAWWDLRVAVGSSRRIQIVLRAATWFGVTLSGTALALLVVPGAEAGRPVLLAYDAALIALAIGLLVALLLASWERTTVTELVVELAADRARSVEASLARALRDSAASGLLGRRIRRLRRCDWSPGQPAQL